MSEYQETIDRIHREEEECGYSAYEMEEIRKCVEREHQEWQRHFDQYLLALVEHVDEPANIVSRASKLADLRAAEIARRREEIMCLD